MSERPSRTKSLIRAALFLLGILISVSAWFIDKALHFPAILRMVAPDYAAVQGAIEILDQGEKAVLPLDHPGSTVLLQWWEPHPSEDVTNSISGIGRSTGVFNIITGVHFYELRLLTENNAFILKDYIWKNTRAKELMQKNLDSGLLKWSFGLFALGLLLTISMFVWESLE